MVVAGLLVLCSPESEAGSVVLSSSVPDAGSSVLDEGFSETSGVDSPSVSVGVPLSEVTVSVGSGTSPESVELGLVVSPVSVGSGASPESVAVGSFVVAGPESSDPSVAVDSVPVVVVMGTSVAVGLLPSEVEVDASDEALDVGF